MQGTLLNLHYNRWLDFLRGLKLNKVNLNKY